MGGIFKGKINWLGKKKRGVEQGLQKAEWWYCRNMESDSWYMIGAIITGGIAFFVLWIYAFFAWGFLIGLAIGWLPAIIGAFIIGLLWPLVVLALIVIGILILVSLY